MLNISCSSEIKDIDTPNWDIYMAYCICIYTKYFNNLYLDGEIWVDHFILKLSI